MPLSVGAVFGYFGVYLGVSIISGEPVNILSWNCVQLWLVSLWQLLHQKKKKNSPHCSLCMEPFLGYFWAHFGEKYWNALKK